MKAFGAAVAAGAAGDSVTFFESAEEDERPKVKKEAM